MNGNKLYVSIPSEFEDLKKLKYLYISANDPKVGYFPPKLKEWKNNLEVFDSDFKDPNQALERDKEVVMSIWKDMHGRVEKLQNDAGDNIMKWWGVTVSGEVSQLFGVNLKKVAPLICRFSARARRSSATCV